MSACIIPESAFKHFPTSMDARADGSNGGIHEGSDFIVRKPFQVTKNQYGPVVSWKCLESGNNIITEHACMQTSEMSFTHKNVKMAFVVIIPSKVFS
jgi:hypothetical protein